MKVVKTCCVILIGVLSSALGSTPALAQAVNTGSAQPRSGPTDKSSAAQWPKTITVDVADGVRMDFVLIPAGMFQMGSASYDEDEKPVHRVAISKPFYMGKHEVTQQQWTALMHNNPSQFIGPQRPVETVKFEDCQAFLAALSAKYSGCKFTLPTEAQWEYACRAGSTTEFCFGDDEGKLRQYAWYGKNSQKETHPVGEKHANGWGLYDMHGNVWEWCLDWDGPYPAGDQTDPPGPASGEKRILRGGSWRSPPRGCRSANRPYTEGPQPNVRGSVGFRVVVGTEIVARLGQVKPKAGDAPRKTDAKSAKPGGSGEAGGRPQP
jgi:formylglycine-generating enzyme required for sulfatase activity